MYLTSYCLMTCLMTKPPTKQFFSRRLNLAEFSARAIIHFLPSSALDIGIIAKVRTRKPAFTLQEWSGGCLLRIKTSLSQRLNHT